MTPRAPNLPRVQERDALQKLLPGNWKCDHDLYPTGSKTLGKMVEKGWIEKRVTQKVEFKITAAGRQAFHDRLPA